MVELETALSIERRFRQEWGEEAASADPKRFCDTVMREVLKIDESGRRWRAVIVRGTFGPHVSDDDYLPISCCAGKPTTPGESLERMHSTHEDECRFAAPSVGALLASGGVLSYPPTGRNE